MNIADLGMPKIRRKQKGAPKPPYVPPADMELSGDNITDFVDNILSKNPHFQKRKALTDMLPGIRRAAKVVGVAKPDKSLGKLISAMHGRFWYYA